MRAQWGSCRFRPIGEECLDVGATEAAVPGGSAGRRDPTGSFPAFQRVDRDSDEAGGFTYTEPVVRSMLCLHGSKPSMLRQVMSTTAGNVNHRN